MQFHDDTGGWGNTTGVQVDSTGYPKKLEPMQVRGTGLALAALQDTDNRTCSCTGVLLLVLHWTCQLDVMHVGEQDTVLNP